MIQILTGDALEQLKTLPDQSVNCFVTSPPYYNLRDYGVDGQIGLERAPEEYIQKLVEVFREARRVLRDDGTLWINIADSYAGSGKGRNTDGTYNKKSAKAKQGTNKGSIEGNLTPTTAGIIYKPKDLIGIPWMLAFALRADGWHLRQEVIWSKPNPMPESVRDRCTKSHESIFLLSKSRKYYFDAEAIAEPCVGFGNNAGRRKENNKTFRGGGVYTNNRSFSNSAGKEKASVGNKPNEKGLRNKRDVWTVGTRGYSGAHFATFPPDLIEPCILAGCPRGGTVCDMFSGSGTVGVVAKAHGRNAILIDLNPEYTDMQRQRIENTITSPRKRSKQELTLSGWGDG